MAAHRSDQAIAELWQWLQNDPRYKGKTSLLITTDHGRGNENLETWKHHGRFPYTKADGSKAISDFLGDDQIWMAVLGPYTPARGEIADGKTVRLNQIAATSAKLLGYNYKSDHPSLASGDVIKTMLK